MEVELIGRTLKSILAINLLVKEKKEHSRKEESRRKQSTNENANLTKADKFVVRRDPSLK